MMKHEGQDIGFDAMEASMAFRATTGLDTSVTSRDTTVPIDLEWRDLTFDVPVGREKNRKSSKLAPELVADTPPPMSDGGSTPVKSGTRRVLHGINGQVRSGQVLAIMGASGSGKTTMLNMLSGRMKSSNKCNAGGKILVNGRQRDFNTFRHIAKFVEQDDTTMFAELTVREQIVYAARLSLPNSVPEDRKIVRVEKIIQELGLSKCADTYIGSEIVRGVSGGERRRASIGIELVTDPSLIFLDEPTTGLDSFNAMNVMASLRHLARNGRTIVTTIHQPRSSIFHMFDFLCLIAEGRTVYFGPASEAAAYFGRIGFHMPTTFNVADYAIDVLSIDRRSSTKETKSMARIQYIANHYSTNVEPGLLEEWANNPHADIDQSNNARLNFGNNLLREFQILAMRTFLLMSREKQINFTRLGQTLFFGVVLGLVWLNSGREDTPGDRFAIQGVIFFICVNQYVKVIFILTFFCCFGSYVTNPTFSFHVFFFSSDVSMLHLELFSHILLKEQLQTGNVQVVTTETYLTLSANNCVNYLVLCFSMY